MNISDKVMWVVINPGYISTLEDICFKSSLKDIARQIIGAKKHWEEYNPEYYDRELDAIRDAQKRLDRRPKLHSLFDIETNKYLASYSLKPLVINWSENQKDALTFSSKEELHKIILDTRLIMKLMIEIQVKPIDIELDT